MWRGRGWSNGRRAGTAARRGAGGTASTGHLGPLALRVAKDLLNGFVARRRLYEGPPSVVHAALMADGGELREEAIRVAGERQLREEAPTLLKLLGDDDETVRDAALGSLIALRDRRAVSELTRTRSLRDRREMRKIIEAISILGGQEAEEYLSFVAATHDDDEIGGPKQQPPGPAAACCAGRATRDGADCPTLGANYDLDCCIF